MKGISYTGLDVHKSKVNVALLLPGEKEPVRWQCQNTVAAVRKMARKAARRSPGEVRFCYEAGPCGYVIQRNLHAMGLSCDVVAPALIPVKPGERIKTDRRDAKKLGELHRAGLLTAVAPPSEEEEAVRELCRFRDAVKKDQKRWRNRIGKFLLRRGRIYRQTKSAWTKSHRRWLRQQRFEHAPNQQVFDQALLALEQVEAQLAVVEAQLEAIAQTEPYAKPVGWLRCFRGIDTLIAITIVAELHGFARFGCPRDLMAYLGLVPSEHSSVVPRRGSITKTGNSHVRRVLVEAAWSYRHRPSVGVALRKRRAAQPSQIISIADKAQQRLNRRHWALVNRGKHTNVATVAVARELVGFIWAALNEGQRLEQIN